ncbi:hypothetical protein EW093_05875 [Thiospirochaeta perfilievii]|uniref:Clostripain n=1 Tax=Thiospirochaeta perfilievii TaxID=252967 RepID=A0A5C1Q871_9SPIO|nr:clostripain-related cysteine peptidase [Thiospirochaeta perfilievii]QEN04245.1 hypothetical protein EW093_05875 [Thiospirochaeta perfilievii]
MNLKTPTILLIILTIVSCSLESSYPKADWTIMFYLADDYITLPLTADIDELTSKEVVTKSIRLVILYDGPLNGDGTLTVLDSPFITNSRNIELSSTAININSENELDMAKEETLESYIKYVKDKLPADNYGLYFGSHGTGYKSWVESGLAVENGEDQLLTPKEISSAIKNTGEMSIVVFDACNMGNIETLYEFKETKVEYIIASPELIPGPGNDYINFINAVYQAPNLTPQSLGETTLEVYYNYYKENPTINNNHNAESLQNLYNVGEIKKIVESNEFKNELTTLLSKKDNNTTMFDFEEYDIFTETPTKPNYSNILDILDNQYMFNNAITKPQNGDYLWLSIYTPTIYNPGYEDTKFANETGWNDIVKNQ